MSRISNIEKFVLNKLVSRLVMQGHYHKHNIRELYKIISKCSYNEFTEDNGVTLKSFLLECFEEAFSSEVGEVDTDLEIYSVYNKNMKEYISSRTKRKDK